MNTFRVEYLVTIDQEEPFCNSISALNSFLCSLDKVSIDSKIIVFNSNPPLKAKYDVQIGNIITDKDSHHYFHIKIILEADSQAPNFDNELKQFEELLRTLRTGLYRIGNKNKPLTILWDGVGLFYAQKAYPMIYDIENIMRKLLTKFMLINVGLGWADESTPQEVKDSIKKENRDQKEQDLLYKVDFIQLSYFLFNKYTRKLRTTSSLFDQISKAKVINDLKLDEVKEYVPQSNWERYFSSIVKAEEDNLKKKWEELYQKRNKVAHNLPLSREDFSIIISLISELKPKLEEAVNNLDKIDIPEVEREDIAENIASTKNPDFGEFLMVWIEIEEILNKLSLDKSFTTEDKSKSPKPQFKGAGPIIKGLNIDTSLKDELVSLNNFRNTIVHKGTSEISEETIKKNTNYAKQCLKILKELLAKQG